MFSIIGVPSHFANGVVRWLHYLGGPQLTKVDHGSSGKVFPFPSVFTDLNSIPPPLYLCTSFGGPNGWRSADPNRGSSRDESEESNRRRQSDRTIEI